MQWLEIRCYHTTRKAAELGHSHHFVKVMNLAIKCPSVYSVKTVRRAFSKRNIEILNNQLKIEKWEDVYLQTHINSEYSLTNFLLLL